MENEMENEGQELKVITFVQNIDLPDSVVESFFEAIDLNNSDALTVIEEKDGHASLVYGTFDPLVMGDSIKECSPKHLMQIPRKTALSITSYLVCEQLKMTTYYNFNTERMSWDQNFVDILKECIIENGRDNKLISTKTLLHPNRYADEDNFFACDLNDPFYQEYISEEFIEGLKASAWDQEQPNMIYPEKFFAVQAFQYPFNDEDGCPVIHFSDLLENETKEPLKPIFVLFMQQKGEILDINYLDTEEEVQLYLEQLEKAFLLPKIIEDPALVQVNEAFSGFDWDRIAPHIINIGEFDAEFTVLDNDSTVVKDPDFKKINLKSVINSAVQHPN